LQTFSNPPRSIVNLDAIEPKFRLAIRPPVVLIVLDEFPGASLVKPDGSFQKERFPNLNSLKNQSSYYPYHSAASNFTLRALPAILSGIVEREVLLKETLFNDFKKIKYRSSISEPFPQFSHFCPGCIQAKPYSYLAGTKADNKRDMMLASAINDLKTIKAGRFSVIHALYPHIPYDRFPSGKKYTDQEFFFGVPSGFDFLDPASNNDNQIKTVMAEQRFLMQAQFTDKIVGSVIKNLKLSGNWDQTTLIITADHGGAFTANTGRRTVKN